jgi:uncharacterized protein (DUF433 family)
MAKARKQTEPENGALSPVGGQNGDRIAKDAEIVGGDARIAGHRIPVWVLEGYRRLGMTDEQILVAYPTLTLPDLVAAWAYVDANQEEIEQALRENR